MFTSAADVFRTRQVTSDLTAYLTRSGRKTLCRVPSEQGVRGRLFSVLDKRGGRFAFPGDRRAYGEVLLAAALPDDDYPAFTAATALLLLDRLNGGDGEDNLYWNWDAFRDHYRLADPPVRAMLMNAFRVAEASGRVALCDPPDPVDCLTERPESLVPRLRMSGQGILADAIDEDVSPEIAGRLWTLMSRTPSTPEQVAGFRYLYERPAAFAPPDRGNAPPIPWTLDPMDTAGLAP